MRIYIAGFGNGTHFERETIKDSKGQDWMPYLYYRDRDKAVRGLRELSDDGLRSKHPYELKTSEKVVCCKCGHAYNATRILCNLSEPAQSYYCETCSAKYHQVYFENIRDAFMHNTNFFLVND